MMMKLASIAPGMKAPVKRALIEVSVIRPKMIRTIDGGIIVPSEPGGADRADGEVLVVAQTQHLRQRDEAEKDDFAADDTDIAGHDHGHQRGDDGDAAAVRLSQ